jgi:hypothetical protein
MTGARRRRRKAAVAEMVQWTGTAASAAELKEWTGTAEVPSPFGPVRRHVFRTDAELTAPADDSAWLWVAHRAALMEVPLGYWVIRELDGSGFYAISDSDLELCYGEWVGCANDTDGDGDCAACARNPDAPCRVMPTVYGIRGHRVMTAEQAAEAQRAYEAAPLAGLAMVHELLAVTPVRGIAGHVAVTPELQEALEPFVDRPGEDGP